jgi:hypothetical protein
VVAAVEQVLAQVSFQSTHQRFQMHLQLLQFWLAQVVRGEHL